MNFDAGQISIISTFFFRFFGFWFSADKERSYISTNNCELLINSLPLLSNSNTYYGVWSTYL
jgi:hypothetical protein